MIENNVKERVSLIPSTSRVSTTIGGNLVTEPFTSVMLGDGEGEAPDLLGGSVDAENHEPTAGFERRIALQSQRRAARIDSPRAWIQAGYASLAAGLINDAVDAFEKALAVDSDNRAAVLGLARSRFAREEAQEAKSLLRALLGRDPNDLEAVVSLAIVTLTESGPAEALALLDRPSAESPVGASLLATRGAVQLQLKNYSAAISDFRKALRLKPEWGHVWNALGLAQLGAGRLEQAESSFRRSARAAPTYPDAHVNLLRLLKMQHRWANLLRMAEHTWPSGVPPIIVARLAAEASLELNDVRAARTWLERVRDQVSSPEDRAAVYNNLGVCHLRIGDYAIANRAFTISVEALAAETNVGNRALALLELGNAAEAVTWLETWIPKPAFDSIRLTNLLIRSYWTLGKTEHAYSLGLAASERSDATESTLGMLSSLAVDYAGQAEIAVSACRQGLLIAPQSTWLKNNLAYSLLQGGRADDAEAVLTAAFAELKPGSNRVFLTATHGLLELHRGNIPGGRELYEQALALAGTHSLREKIKVKRDLETARAMLRLGGNVADARRLLDRAAGGGSEAEPYSTHAVMELRRLVAGS